MLCQPELQPRDVGFWIHGVGHGRPTTRHSRLALCRDVSVGLTESPEFLGNKQVVSRPEQTAQTDELLGASQRVAGSPALTRTAPSGWVLAWEKLLEPVDPDRFRSPWWGWGALVVNLTCALLLGRFRTDPGVSQPRRSRGHGLASHGCRVTPGCCRPSSLTSPPLPG